MRKPGLGLGLVLAGALAGTACTVSNPVTAPADGGTRNLLASPVLKVVGVTSMVLSVIGLAGTSMAVALASPSLSAKALLIVAAVSVAAGMIVAGVYGAGELAATGWIGIPRMVKVHGLFNGVGFTLCGLTAHLRARGVLLQRNADANRPASQSVDI